MRRMWHLWPGQLWPFTLEQETEFAAQLLAAATRPVRSDRDDLTALLGILRCGCTLNDALTIAPGLRLNRIAHAYNMLNTNLRQARESWDALLAAADDDPFRVTEYADKATLLMPNFVKQVCSAVVSESPDMLRSTLRSVRGQIDTTMQRAAHIESQCAQLAPASPAVIELGTELFHPHRSGLYASQTYLPDRVSALSSVRVSDLCGLERL